LDSGNVLFLLPHYFHPTTPKKHSNSTPAKHLKIATFGNSSRKFNGEIGFLDGLRLAVSLKIKTMTKLTFKIDKDIPTTIKYLTETDKFVSVHPLIYKMTDLNNNNYKVYERVKFGFFTYNFSYYAKITQIDNYLQINASIMGLTKLTMQFNFLKEGNETIINEEIIIQSILPIKNNMTNLITKQHKEMFININNSTND
jgi:carbon monoxide dehydrogenase subunit G